MADFLTSQLMLAVYLYISGCILAKALIKHLDINDPEDKYSWVLSWVCVFVLIIRAVE